MAHYNFLHIAKCGGTTIKSVLSRVGFDAIYSIKGEQAEEYDSQIQTIIEQHTQSGAQPTLISGHQAYGIHYLVPKNIEYITFLRNPVERVKSYYKHASDLGRSRGCKAVNIIDYLNRENNWQCNNGITRILSATSPFFKDLNFDPIKEEHYRRAWENLRRFFCVGFIEEYARSNYILHQQLQSPIWAYFYKKKNVRTHKEVLTSDELNYIRETNFWDIQLYQTALSYFTDRYKIDNNFKFQVVANLNSLISKIA
jgi:hypothetical protein